MWVSNPIAVLFEMKRVVRPGGWVVAFAEPDYGGRIDEPEELEKISAIQELSLKQQGAETRMGRKLSGLFHQNGFVDIECGVMGAQWNQSSIRSSEESDQEWQVMKSDLNRFNSIHNFEEFRLMDLAARQSGSRILFVPTFYAMGRAPNDK